MEMEKMIFMSMETANYLLIFVSLYFLTNQIIKKFQNLPPSPPLRLPVLGHLHLLKKPLHKTLAKVSEKHGPILLLHFGSCPVLLVSNPSIVEGCFTENDIVFSDRPRFLAGKYLGNDYTTLTWTSYGKNWRNLRKIATLEILSSSRVHMFTEIRQQEVRSLIQRLRNASKYGSAIVEMKSVFFELTLNIMMRMIAGKRYYEDDIEQGREEATRFQEIVAETFQVSGAMNIADFVPLLRWFGGAKRLENKLKKLQEKRDKLMQNLLEERKTLRASSPDWENQKQNKTMIDVLLSLQETEPEYYTDELIKGMIQVMLSAGTDTSANTMEWTLSALLNNPACLSKAREEIDDRIGKSRLMNDSDLGHLPYLHGIINETLRMYPVAPLLVPRVSSEECVVGGYRVPSGSLLIVNVWAMHNDPKLWEESTIFKPERFVNLDGRKDEFVFMPFGHGRRGCPGENMAMRVIGLTLGLMIQCFDWERNGEELVDMSGGPGLTMPKANPLIAKCKPRLEMIQLLSELF